MPDDHREPPPEDPPPDDDAAQLDSALRLVPGPLAAAARAATASGSLPPLPSDASLPDESLDIDFSWSNALDNLLTDTDYLQLTPADPPTSLPLSLPDFDSQPIPQPPPPTQPPPQSATHAPSSVPRRRPNTSPRPAKRPRPRPSSPQSPIKIAPRATRDASPAPPLSSPPTAASAPRPNPSQPEHLLPNAFPFALQPSSHSAQPAHFLPAPPLPPQLYPLQYHHAAMPPNRTTRTENQSDSPTPCSTTSASHPLSSSPPSSAPTPFLSSTPIPYDEFTVMSFFHMAQQMYATAIASGAYPSQPVPSVFVPNPSAIPPRHMSPFPRPMPPTHPANASANAPSMAPDQQPSNQPTPTPSPPQQQQKPSNTNPNPPATALSLAQPTVTTQPTLVRQPYQQQAGQTPSQSTSAICLLQDGHQRAIPPQKPARLIPHPFLGRLQLQCDSKTITTRPKSAGAVPTSTGVSSPGLSVSRGASSSAPSSENRPHKKRLVWTPELHERFVSAVNAVGLANAVPKVLVSIMNVNGLTTEHVKSHLQKYRNSLKKEAADEVRVTQLTVHPWRVTCPGAQSVALAQSGHTAFAAPAARRSFESMAERTVGEATMVAEHAHKAATGRAAAIANNATGSASAPASSKVEVAAGCATAGSTNNGKTRVRTNAKTNTEPKRSGDEKAQIGGGTADKKKEKPGEGEVGEVNKVENSSDGGNGADGGDGGNTDEDRHVGMVEEQILQLQLRVQKLVHRSIRMQRRMEQKQSSEVVNESIDATNGSVQEGGGTEVDENEISGRKGEIASEVALGELGDSAGAEMQALLNEQMVLQRELAAHRATVSGLKEPGASKKKTQKKGKEDAGEGANKDGKVEEACGRGGGGQRSRQAGKGEGVTVDSGIRVKAERALKEGQ